MDDAILFYEILKISKNVGIIYDALYHKEIDSIIGVKNYKYGTNTKEFLNEFKELEKDKRYKEKVNEYLNLIKKRQSFRKANWKYPKLIIKSYI
ncbi:hypothetical protein MJ1_0345 [Nanobdella aerobiophila]|uniref:Uncharacterized protein n=1 Tax=Nanobdella aerobiophila TaxID=2586965 RepID=A0A915SFM8_9ARCH|nr:hypothetical protein [Nanobdella aerobiophila]BBL45509.1 hypothetical protein MJ1_0345 [Nanobdella aerobiophila]